MIVHSEFGIHHDITTQEVVTSYIKKCGFRAVIVDHMFKGKGSDFTRLKVKFDDIDDPTPMAMCCFSMTTQLLTGTNLDRADAFVTIGSIPETVLTQSLGRIFRPLESRDNTQAFPMIRIYS